MAHFRFKSVQKRVIKIKFNEDFYDKYAETVATLFLYGIKGLADQRRARRAKR